MSTNTGRFGQLEPRYTCCLNPFVDLRFSRCPTCEGRTQVRKFALVVHVDPEGIFPTRIACKWCRKCGLIIVPKREFEDTLWTGIAEKLPDRVGADYLIIGTLEMKIWTRLHQGFAVLETVQRWTSDFLNFAELTMIDRSE